MNEISNLQANQVILAPQYNSSHVTKREGAKTSLNQLGKTQTLQGSVQKKQSTKQQQVVSVRNNNQRQDSLNVKRKTPQIMSLAITNTNNFNQPFKPSMQNNSGIQTITNNQLVTSGMNP